MDELRLKVPDLIFDHLDTEQDNMLVGLPEEMKHSSCLTLEDTRDVELATVFQKMGVNCKPSR